MKICRSVEHDDGRRVLAYLVRLAELRRAGSDIRQAVRRPRGGHLVVRCYSVCATLRYLAIR